MATEMSEESVAKAITNYGPKPLVKGVTSIQPQGRVAMWERTLALSDSVIKRIHNPNYHGESQ